MMTLLTEVTIRRILLGLLNVTNWVLLRELRASRKILLEVLRGTNWVLLLGVLWRILLIMRHDVGIKIRVR